MKKLYLVLLIAFGGNMVMAQSDTTMNKFVDSVCGCLSRLDLKSVNTQRDAQLAISNCFLKDNMGMLMQLAEQRGTNITDQAAMEKIGQEVGLELVKRNCKPFIQLSMKLAGQGQIKQELTSENSTSGTLASIETKEFSKFILTESGGRRGTYYWLHHFKNSEKFIDQPTKLIGKKMRVSWQETEVYIPAAKGYFKINEITGIEML